jgi:hypothetical protein
MVILRPQHHTLTNCEFTVPVEDAQEYAAFLHRHAGTLASRKWESASLYHTKNAVKKPKT